MTSGDSGWTNLVGGRPYFYTLDRDGEPRPIHELRTSELNWDIDARRVALDELPNGWRVSTVFLGVDHAFGDGPPVLWETLAEGPNGAEIMDRYTSRAEAEAGHWAIVERVQRGEVE